MIGLGASSIPMIAYGTHKVTAQGIPMTEIKATAVGHDLTLRVDMASRAKNRCEISQTVASLRMVTAWSRLELLRGTSHDSETFAARAVTESSKNAAVPISVLSIDVSYAIARDSDLRCNVSAERSAVRQ